MGFRGTNVAVPSNVPDGNPGRELFKVLRSFQVPIRFRKMLPTFVNSAMFATVSDEAPRVLILYGTSGSADDAGPAGDFGDLRSAEDARSSRPPRERDSTPTRFLSSAYIKTACSNRPSDNATMSEMRDVTFCSDLTSAAISGLESVYHHSISFQVCNRSLYRSEQTSLIL